MGFSQFLRSRAGCQRRALATVASGLFLAPALANAGGHTPIYDIQGAGHLSPFAGVEVTTQGVVTALAFRGYYIQDPTGDGDDATSDGMFVFEPGSLPEIGDLLQLTDTVTEFVPGGCGTGNLSITQMSSPDTTLLAPGTPLPDPVLVGQKGRIPPSEVVISASELPVNQQPSFCAGGGDAGVFNPDVDGIDFYESLEGMLVTIDDPVAVSGTRTFSPFASEIFTLASRGKFIAPQDARTRRGGIELQPHPDNLGDQNPERVQIQFDPTISDGFPVPAIPVGSRLSDVTGVVGYSFGNFEVNVTEPFQWQTSRNVREATYLFPAHDRVTVASYNVLNHSATFADDAQRATLASQIVNNLRSPDVIALQEIQDNNGELDDGTVDASQTLQALADAVWQAGGPMYSFVDVAPIDNTSGGVPGGNIRNAFFYNPDRVGLIGLTSLTPAELAGAGVSEPNAFDGTRDPLAATFSFGGEQFIVVNNHLTSRFGSTPVFGGPQPFVQAGEAERASQTGALNEYVDHLLGIDADAHVIVLGDLNTFQWTDDLAEILPGTGPDRVLTNLIPARLEGTDRDNVYTFNFEGNSQALDHFFITDGLWQHAKFDIAHVNVDFPRVDQSVGSDHEPLIASFKLK